MGLPIALLREGGGFVMGFLGRETVQHPPVPNIISLHPPAPKELRKKIRNHQDAGQDLATQHEL